MLLRQILWTILKNSKLWRDKNHVWWKSNTEIHPPFSDSLWLGYLTLQKLLTQLLWTIFKNSRLWMDSNGTEIIFCSWSILLLQNYAYKNHIIWWKSNTGIHPHFSDSLWSWYLTLQMLLRKLLWTIFKNSRLWMDSNGTEIIFFKWSILLLQTYAYKNHIWWKSNTEIHHHFYDSLWSWYLTL